MSKAQIIERKPKPGDLAVYMKCLPDTRKLIGYISIITKIKHSKIQVFDPTAKTKYFLRYNDLMDIIGGVDDLGGTKSQRDLDFINDINRDMDNDDF